MIQNKVTIFANAKINLTLDITGRRADGYHELDSVMQSVTLHDTVTVEPADTLTVTCDLPSLSGEQNLAHRAALLFFEAAGVKGGARILIEKRIPVAAGLAGGSADAAAVLTGLNALYGTGLDLERLCELGLGAGADVPFCIAGGTRRARGIGERLTVLPLLPSCTIVIAKRGEKSSTGALYARFDSAGAKKRPRTEEMLAALERQSLAGTARCLCNVFEELVPQSFETRNAMLRNGALGAALSGSGPSVFGIFDDEGAAQASKTALGAGAIVCKPAPMGCEVNSAERYI